MKSPIFRVFQYLRHFPKELILNIGFNILYVFFNLFSFALIIPFVELLFGMIEAPEIKPHFSLSQNDLIPWMLWQLNEIQSEHGVWKCLIVVSIGYLSANFLSNLSRYLGLYFVGPIRNGIVQRLRDDLYQRLTILPVAYYSSQRKGDIMSRFSNDMADVEWCVVSTLQSLIKDPIKAIVFAITLAVINWRLFLLFLVLSPLSVCIIVKIGKSLKRNSSKGQSKLGELFSVLEEGLSGMRVIKSYNKESHQEEKFNKVNHQFMRTMIKVARRRELSAPLSEILGTMALVAILVVGCNIVMNGGMRSSVFIFFIIIFSQLIPPIQAVIKAYNSLLKGSASAKRIFEIMDADESILEDPEAKTIQGLKMGIEYKDVTFAYQESEQGESRYVLKGINFTLCKGKKIALVGPSGGGKSTLVDLLPRFYDVSSGCILWDGEDIKKLNINSLREQIGIVSQDCILFNDTVANNIAFGRKNYSLESVVEAAKVAYAHDFIMNLPDGYNTIIGDRGLLLSGGQRQRLSIARAVLKNPPLMILDEATSALDAESEKMVKDALDSLMENRTAIVIAHRLSTIQNMDEILVIDDGKIAERGSHFSLFSQNGIYKNLVKMQSFE